jgi:hypothetical protein
MTAGDSTYFNSVDDAIDVGSLVELRSPRRAIDCPTVGREVGPVHSIYIGLKESARRYGDRLE